jgi:hypothetical protein
MTGEFNHYPGCKGNDPDNCSACALTKPTLIDFGEGVERMGINYAAWPLSYMQNGRRIPEKFMEYLALELESDNLAYVRNLIQHLKEYGYDLEKIRTYKKGGE